ncbi:divalent-cation tolerance protein CutA [Actinoalloteichus caeruleus]|uniref:divalent-cation tolerance protein CutA n=1 Tax=Actinoalloteichus cyanogriseus TaxID=2893586 RepID=UPI002FF5CFDA
MTTVDSADQAQELARGAVEARLPACARVVGPVVSVHRWEGEVRTDQEWQVVRKTTAAATDRLVEHPRSTHGYDVPEVIASPITRGNPAYLSWLDEETAQAPVGSGPPALVRRAGEAGGAMAPISYSRSSGGGRDIPGPRLGGGTARSVAAEAWRHDARVGAAWCSPVVHLADGRRSYGRLVPVAELPGGPRVHPATRRTPHHPPAARRRARRRPLGHHLPVPLRRRLRARRPQPFRQPVLR